MKNTKTIKKFLLGWLVFAIWMTACATPDTKPFADSTATIAQGIRKVGQVTDKILSKTRVAVPGGDIVVSSDKRHPIERYREAWATHLEAVEALEAYSAALVEINAASKKASANAENVVTPFMSLASYVPNVGMAADEAGALVNLILTSVNEIRAFNSMADKVERAHPVLEQITPIITKGLTEAYTNIYKPSLNERIQTLEKKNYNLAGRYNASLKLLNDKEKSFLRADAEAKDALKMDIEVVKGIVDRLAVDYKTFKDQIAAEEAKRAATEELYNTTIKGLKKWLQTHAALRNALKEGRQPNFTVIMIRAQETKTAAEALEEKL